MPRSLFPESPTPTGASISDPITNVSPTLFNVAPTGASILDTITNVSPTLLNAAVLPRSPSLLNVIPPPPPPDFSINAFLFATPLALPHAPCYDDALNPCKEEEPFSFFSSPRPFDYSVLDNVSTEWRAPTFELVMNQDPHGENPILVDMFAFTQECPDKRKKQRPEKDDWLYFPPNVIPTTYEFINGKKRILPTNLPKYLNDTSCINNGVVVMSNGYKPSKKN
jgi:hypothetical protein